ncbi:nascent polypeptide-associated complex protein [Candidatus Woesearchaeota archaeon]|nr:nascent polypeptide-associated complex protein [Candidatus Woesearchaeota archaeon]
MIPGMNPRQMKQAMKRMGIQQQEIDAKEVIIKLEDKEIVISNPSVSKVNMMGQQTYQVVGEEEIRELDSTPDISDDDVKTVMEQTDASEKDAKAAIEECKGDLAEAILKLKKE